MDETTQYFGSLLHARGSLALVVGSGFGAFRWRLLLGSISESPSMS